MFQAKTLLLLPVEVKAVGVMFTLPRLQDRHQDLQSPAYPVRNMMLSLN